MFDIQTDVVEPSTSITAASRLCRGSIERRRPEKQQVVDMKKVDETAPSLRNIDINHVICRGARRAA